MSIFQIQLPIGNSPISLTCFSDGMIGFTPVMVFGTMIEEYVEGKVAMWDHLGFSINGKEYHYNTKYAYKNISDMLEYLQSLKMEMPRFN